MLNFTCKVIGSLGLCLTISLLSGCTGTGQNWTRSLAWWKKDTPSPYKTRADRLEQLQQLAQEAPDADAARQEEVSVALGRAIHDENDPILRAAMLRTLGNYQTSLSSSILAAGLSDTDPKVRTAACEGLAKRGGKESVELLSKQVSSDTDLDVRLAAIRCLGELKDPAATPALAVCLEDTNPAVQHRAIRSLEKSTGKDFGDSVVAWRQYTSGQEPKVESPSMVARLRQLW